MIEIYSELQEENSCRKLIKSNESQHIYFEAKEYLDFEMKNFKNLHTDRILKDLSHKRDSEFEYQTVEFNGMITRIREKDCNTLQLISLVGGQYLFENGVLELAQEEAKQILAQILTNRTKIVNRKRELEGEIKSLDLFELSRFNVYCEW